MSGKAVVGIRERRRYAPALVSHLDGTTRPETALDEKSCRELRGRAPVEELLPDGKAHVNAILEAHRANRRRGRQPNELVEFMLAGPPPWEQARDKDGDLVGEPPWPREKVDRWAGASVAWAQGGVFGPEFAMLGAWLHGDEMSPHVHIGGVPILDGRISWKAVKERFTSKFLGRKRVHHRVVYSAMRDSYYEQVGQHFGLARGAVKVFDEKGQDAEPIDRQKAAIHAARVAKARAEAAQDACRIAAWKAVRQQWAIRRQARELEEVSRELEGKREEVEAAATAEARAAAAEEAWKVAEREAANAEHKRASVEKAAAAVDERAVECRREVAELETRAKEREERLEELKLAIDREKPELERMHTEASELREASEVGKRGALGRQSKRGREVVAERDKAVAERDQAKQAGAAAVARAEKAQRALAHERDTHAATRTWFEEVKAELLRFKEAWRSASEQVTKLMTELNTLRQEWTRKERGHEAAVAAARAEGHAAAVRELSAGQGGDRGVGL